MNWLECLHAGAIHERRARVLGAEIARLIPANASVLDVGCGDGFLGRKLMDQRPDISLMGIDTLKRPHARIPIAEYDGKKIPHLNRSYDVVMFVDVLHHTSDPAALLREAARVSRFSVIIKDHLCRNRLSYRLLRFMDDVGNRRHGVELLYNYWSKEQWLEAFDSLGFQTYAWKEKLKLYPPLVDSLFGESLHFMAALSISSSK